MKPELGIYGPYVDEPIGMDHPLFMARTQARMWAALAAREGIPLEDMLRNVRKQALGLFGEVPLALVEVSATTAYLEASVLQGGCDE